MATSFFSKDEAQEILLRQNQNLTSTKHNHNPLSLPVCRVLKTLDGQERIGKIDASISACPKNRLSHEILSDRAVFT